MSRTTVDSEKTGVVYRSRVRVEPKAGGVKMVYLPMEAVGIPMGLHGAIAAHYKVPEGTFTPHASTLDYIVGATAGCLMGTLNRALQARKIETGDGKLATEAFGEIELEDDVLVIRRIRILVHLRADAAQQAAAERVIGVYASSCPVYRTLYKAIEITTDLDFQPVPAA